MLSVTGKVHSTQPYTTPPTKTLMPWATGFTPNRSLLYLSLLNFKRFLHATYFNIKAAFDSVDFESLWKVPRSNKIPVTAYPNSESSHIHNDFYKGTCQTLPTLPCILWFPSALGLHACPSVASWIGSRFGLDYDKNYIFILYWSLTFFMQMMLPFLLMIHPTGQPCLMASIGSWEIGNQTIMAEEQEQESFRPPVRIRTIVTGTLLRLLDSAQSCMYFLIG